MSKLAIPTLPDAIVERPRLAELLDTGKRRSVTLLSAPAGWGKTTLLAWWLRVRRPDGPIAWLTIEREDDERFWEYLCATLRAPAMPGPDAPMSVPAATGTVDAGFLTLLANNLVARPRPMAIVIDNFHNLRSGSASSGLEYLLRHADGRLRLIIAARGEPPLALHRLQLRGELLQIGADDLAFTPDESAAQFRRAGTVLRTQASDLLCRHAEGWPAGLRLASLFVREFADPSGSADRFLGDQPAVAEYFRTEVLAELSTAAQEFLMQTSVADSLSGGLADTLTGGTDGSRRLEEAARTDRFIVPIGGRPSRYRYRPLFGEMLRAELIRRSPASVRTLHRRAAWWFAAQGHTRDALRHALAGEDWQHATTLLNQHWPELVLSNRREPEWSAIGAPPDKSLRRDPALALAAAASSLAHGDRTVARHCLNLARQTANQTNDASRPLALVTTALQLRLSELEADLSDVLRLATQLVALSTESDTAHAEAAGDTNGAAATAVARAVALIARGKALIGKGEWEAAGQALRDGERAASTAPTPLPRLICAANQAVLQALNGDLRLAVDTAQSVLHEFAVPWQPEAAEPAAAYLALATAHYRRGELNDASSYLTIAPSPFDAEPVLGALAATVRAGLLHALGDLKGGCEVLREHREHLAGSTDLSFLYHWLTAIEADLRTSYGDTVTARRLLEPLQHTGGNAADLIAVALARTQLRDGDTGATARTLPVWSNSDSATSPLPVRIEAGLVDALAARRVGDQRRARATLERVLELAEPNSFRQPFLVGGHHARDLLTDHLNSGTAYWPLVRELIQAIDERAGRREPSAAELVQPLTDRELTILRYLQSTLSNMEIGGEIHLSVNTVKTHVRNIYRKLDVVSRRDAVRKARELHLL